MRRRNLRASPCSLRLCVENGASSLQHRFDRRDVDVDRIVDVRGIAAGEDSDQRNTYAAHSLDDEPIPLRQAGLRQPQPAQPIAFVRIGASEIEGLKIAKSAFFPSSMEPMIP